MEPAVRVSDFCEKLNQQMLTVSNLEDGSYALFIDGEKVVEHTAEEWAKGIDLAKLETPMMKQSRRVMELTVKRNEADHLAWQQVAIGLEGNPSTQKAVDALRAVERELHTKQIEACKPVAHKFELRRTS